MEIEARQTDCKRDRLEVEKKSRSMAAGKEMDVSERELKPSREIYFSCYTVNICIPLTETYSTNS